MQRITRLILCTLTVAFPLGSLRAESSIIVDNQTGRILEGVNANQKLQIASLTKLALALVALDWSDLKKGNLDQTATVPEAAISTTGGINPLGLQAGDALTLRDLLFACLLNSDNVAAVTLADHLGRALPNPTGLDPTGNTVSQMNALARQLGMRRTLFLNPHGLDTPEGQSRPYSSASDLARLTRYAYSKSGLSFYVSQPTREIHIKRGGANLSVQLANTNKLLGADHIDGVKTGRTSRAGDCIILSSEHTPEVSRQGDTVFTTPRRIVVVLLGGSNREQEGAALVQRGWALYNDWAAKGRQAKPSNSL
ncbi:MAG: serine hydrolase [Verrucomicrobia bacterium]|nr:serine hydrolase [Verrucomicrobiota bacterium]